MSAAGRGPVAGAAFERQLHRRYGAFAVAFAAFVAGMGLVADTGAHRAWIGGVFLIVTVGVYAGIGFLCRTTNEADYFVAGRRVPALYNGVATAADWMSAASFIGTAGVLYLQGFAGLAYVLGWTGGFFLLAVLLVPYLRRFGQYTVPDFLAARYGGTLPRLVGASAVILVSFIYLVVQIYGVGLITSHLTGFGFDLGILVGLGGVLVCSFLGGMRAVTWTQVAQYIVLIIAFLVPLVWLSVKQTGQPAPALAYGMQLEKINVREQALLNDPDEKEVITLWALHGAEAQRKLQNVPRAIADDLKAMSARVAELRAHGAAPATIQRAERELAAMPRTVPAAEQRYRQEAELARARAHPLAGLPPQALPFPKGSREGDDVSRKRFDASRINFIALVLCLMLGTAAMPHVLIRYQTTPSVAQARRSVGWSLLFIVMLYLGAPALAVLVKFDVLNNIVGLPIDQLPRWIARWAKLDASLVSVVDINRDGILQFGELWLGGDVIVLAAPEIGGLPYFVTCLVAAGGMAAALSTADGLLITIANSVAHDVYYRIINPNAPPLRRVLLSKMLVMVVALVAAAIASLRNTDIVLFVSAAFSLAGAAFFPVLVLGIFWRRANAAGALAGMLAGLGVCLYYMAMNMPVLRRVLGVTAPLADCQWWGIDPIAAGIFGVPAGAVALVLVSWLTQPPSAAQRALVDALRVPADDEQRPA